MTTEQFLEKYPMVSKEDLALVTMHIRMMMQEVEDSISLEYQEEEYDEEYYAPYQYPEYVIASTSDDMEETYVFPSNEAGVITDFNELASIAKRFGDEHWSDHDLVMQQLPGYQLVKQTALNRTLYKLIN